ncbi:MAG: TonB-dependent receptor, partial [Candidatus Omnitrophica bacterium]|nr:TonB-dependent receptor [Candidatus Omnitrophota bacterium]
MNRTILFLLLINGIATAGYAYEREDFFNKEYLSTPAIDLEPLFITSRRSPAGLRDITDTISLIDSQSISAFPARDLADTLKYVPGVDISPRQGMGRATSISIQGSDSRQVRVMVDGIPFNNNVSEQVDPSRLPLGNIERIEVIKGAASSMWGSALGGVINVITKDTGTTLIPQGSATVSWAEFRTQKEAIDLSGKLGPLGYYFFSDYTESGGKGPRDDTLSKKAYGKLSYDLGDAGRLISSFGYSGGDINSGEFPDGTWWAQPYRMRYGKIGWTRQEDEHYLSAELKHSRQDIVSKIYLTVADNEPVMKFVYKDIFYQLSLHAKTRVGDDDILIVGADFDHDTIKSDTFLSKSKNVTLQAPYANYTLKMYPFDFNAGARYDHNSEFGEEVSPSLGIIYHFKNTPGTLIRATATRAFNAPLLIWKYNANPAFGTIPNPDIGAERAWVYELGGESQLTPKLWAKLTFYRADVTDALAQETNGMGESYMKNFEKFRRQGAELELKYTLTDTLTVTASGAFNDIENRITKETVRGGGKPRQSFDVSVEY